MDATLSSIVRRFSPSIPQGRLPSSLGVQYAHPSLSPLSSPTSRRRRLVVDILRSARAVPAFRGATSVRDATRCLNGRTDGRMDGWMERPYAHSQNSSVGVLETGGETWSIHEIRFNYEICRTRTRRETSLRTRTQTWYRWAHVKFNQLDSIRRRQGSSCSTYSLLRLALSPSLPLSLPTTFIFGCRQ